MDKNMAVQSMDNDSISFKYAVYNQGNILLPRDTINQEIDPADYDLNILN